MTDQTPPRPVRANPAPRRALPRVTPLAAVPEDDERVLWASAHAEGAPAAPTEPTEPATGRDLLIPNGPAQPAGKSSAKSGEKAARKGRGAVPAVSELMPPSAPRRKKHGPPPPSTPQPAPPAETATGSPHADDPAPLHDQQPKKGELLITLPKPLRKRLKAKAAGHGMTPEQAVTELISVWVDG